MAKLLNNYSFTLLIVFGLLSGSACAGDGGESESSNNEMSVSEVSDSDFQQIFNGNNLSGWDGDERFWSVANGSIIGETTSEQPTEINTFLVWEEDEPSDFEVQFRYRFVIVSDQEYGNSGMQFRSERFVNDDFPESEYAVRGYQADMAISDWIPGIHYEEGGRGILARRGQKVLIDSDGEMHTERFAEEDALGEYITHTEWNDYHVYANGDTLRVTINGQLMHEIIDQSPEAKDQGIIAFQLHRGPPMRVELTDIGIKYLN